MHFRRITSIYQPTNAHTISHKTLLNTLKHSDMFRSCQIIIRELYSLLTLYYSLHNSIRICKRGVVTAGTKLPDDDLRGSKHIGVV